MSTAFRPFPLNPTVEIINPLTDPRWDSWVSEYPNAQVFHLSAWAKVLRDTYGFEPQYFAASAPEIDTRHLLPVVEVDSWLTGRRGISLPFSDLCPVLGGDGRIAAEVFKTLVDRGIERRWRYIETRDAAPVWPNATPTSSYYTHTLDVSRSESAVISSFDPVVRRNIRKAEKSGVTIEVCSDLASVREHFRLHAFTRKRHGLPPQPFRFFEAIQKHILQPGHGFIAAARLHERTIASVMFFRLGTLAFFKFGASDERYQACRPTNLALWAAIRHSMQTGALTVHFGRNALNHESLRRFKLSWGSSESRVDYFRYDLVESRFAIEPNLLSGWQNHAFRLLPRHLSRIIGSLLYRHIA